MVRPAWSSNRSKIQVRKVAAQGNRLLVDLITPLSSKLWVAGSNPAGVANEFGYTEAGLERCNCDLPGCMITSGLLDCGLR